MSVDVQMEVKACYVHLTCRGAYSRTDGLGAYEKVFDLAAREGRNRVLFDVTGIEGVPPSTLERYKLAIQMVEFQMRQVQGVRIAIVGKEPLIDPKRFGETVAVNRGGTFRIFTDIVEALAWLEKG